MAGLGLDDVIKRNHEINDVNIKHPRGLKAESCKCLSIMRVAECTIYAPKSQIRGIREVYASTALVSMYVVRIVPVTNALRLRLHGRSENVGKVMHGEKVKIPMRAGVLPAKTP